MQVELNLPLAITLPTPVDFSAAHIDLPDGEVTLHCTESGAVITAQKSGDTIYAIVNDMPAGGPYTFDVEAAAAADELGVTVLESADTLSLQLPQGHFGTYHFGADVIRPYIAPVNGPGQIVMTRSVPSGALEGETTDHPHHTSLWAAFDEVNEVNNWHNAEGHGYTRHKSFSNVASGPVFGGFTAQGVWESATGEPVLDETRTIRLYNVGEEIRLLDYEITFAANYGDVTFNDTKEAGVLAVRVATSMDGARGGIISNSEGGRGESECWGKQAAWCDYVGQVNGETLGVTIFDHPQNPNFPTRWHVRDYGLFATNPFSTACFNAGDATPYTIPNGESVTFRYRVLLHRGNTQDVKIAEFYNVWSDLAKVLA